MKDAGGTVMLRATLSLQFPNRVLPSHPPSPPGERGSRELGWKSLQLQDWWERNPSKRFPFRTKREVWKQAFMGSVAEPVSHLGPVTSLLSFPIFKTGSSPGICCRAAGSLRSGMGETPASHSFLNSLSGVGTVMQNEVTCRLD